MGVVILMFMWLIIPSAASSDQIHARTEQDSDAHLRRRVIDLKGSPESVIWVVQLSDLHFSVHHPDRALDFSAMVGPALSMINPSLVLITGDLTDGKSKDLLIMKQDEEEWKEYQKVMDDVVKQSGLDKSIFYDLRGNHDNFGVPVVNGSFDFFSNYSINGQLGRSRKVNSVTVQSGGRKHLFVGFDSTMSVGLRGPTNLFGHPTDQLLMEIDSELSQWNSQSIEPVTKISFGHFPLSFSAFTYSEKNLKDIFLNHSLSSYLCGHLHTKFGKNLKRYHRSGYHFFQLNIHPKPLEKTKDCSDVAPPVKEFWEWEMGDWRTSRAMRILAVDSGLVSFLDIDFKSGAKRTIILPTFPLDSRLMSTSLYLHNYECQSIDPSTYETVRAIVFSVFPIVSVVVRIYDSEPGILTTVLEASMSKQDDNSSRGDLYTARWNFKAFEDPSPVRYWLQIEAIDIRGRSSLTEMRPFSINGLSAKLSWTWKEFIVMGCQWASLYNPVFWACLLFIFSILIIPKFLLTFSREQYAYKSFSVNKGIISGIAWILAEFCRLSFVWFGVLGYLFYLILFPWFSGQVFTDSGERKYMTYKGWVVKIFNDSKKLEFVGSPDIMVVVLSHLCLVVLPSILVAAALAAEKAAYRIQFLSHSGKKEDDYGLENRRDLMYDNWSNRISKFCFGNRWIRKILLVVCLLIFWKHFKNCRALMKAYDMNPLLHFPVYCFSVPVLLAYTIYKTRGVR